LISTHQNSNLRRVLSLLIDYCSLCLYLWWNSVFFDEFIALYVEYFCIQSISKCIVDYRLHCEVCSDKILHLSIRWVNNKHNKLTFRYFSFVLFLNISLILQTAFFLVFTYSDLALFTRLEWYIYVIIFAWPIAILFINELVKSIDRKKHIHEQKFLKLKFETKLGMHSPI
jgi:hypothetical protein